jgi:hypothetical protein
MTEIINITNDVTSFKRRISVSIQIFLFSVLFFAFAFLSDKNPKYFLIFISLIILVFGIFLFKDILKNKLYLADFYSDSNIVKIVYFNASKEQQLETKIENVVIKIKETSGKTGFNFELKIKINNLNFTIDKTFDWILSDMKDLYLFVQYHNNIKLTDKEKYLVQRIEEHIKKVPF